ncbi:MAG: helix-turn-helix transcriptional regulator [Saprospiraceae bacterium]|nr:helix-turn-helix transcriptional regulator [Saprospiraceae bacterium]
MPNIHKKITAVRKKRNLSQPQAAELANISIRTYQRLESGETTVNLDYLNRLADGFQCCLDDILHFDLETNNFPVRNTETLIQNNQALVEENGRLQQFVNWLTEQLRRGGARQTHERLTWGEPVISKGLFCSEHRKGSKPFRRSIPFYLPTINLLHVLNCSPSSTTMYMPEGSEAVGI